jgi:uridine kinase
MTGRGPIPPCSRVALRHPKAGETKFVAIDGHGGAGKSTLAELLAGEFNAEIIHTDDFASWDNPKNWWPRLRERVLEPISGGAQTLSYPRARWWPDHMPEPAVDQPVTPVMILEGMSALRQEFRHYVTFGIFISVSRDVCLQRGVERDANMAPRAEVRRLWERYYSHEEGYMRRDDPESYADLVLDGSKPFEGQLDLRPS